MFSIVSLFRDFPEMKQHTPILDQIRSFPSSTQTSPHRGATILSGIPKVEPIEYSTPVVHTMEKETLVTEHHPQTVHKRIDIMESGEVRVTTTTTKLYTKDMFFALLESHEELEKESKTTNEMASQRKRTADFRDMKSIFQYGSPE